MGLPLAIALGAEALKLGSSLFRESEAKEGLRKLGAPPQYAISPEQQSAYNLAQERSRFGFSPEETAQFRQRMAQDIATGGRQALDIGGGNLARTIGRMGTIQKLGAEADFAAKGAALQRQNIHDYYTQAGQMAAQRNRMLGAQREDYNRAAQAYGMAAQQQWQNVMGALGDIGGAAAWKWAQMPDTKKVVDTVTDVAGNVGARKASSPQLTQQDYPISTPAYTGTTLNLAPSSLYEPGQFGFPTYPSGMGITPSDTTSPEQDNVMDFARQSLYRRFSQGR